MKTEKTLPYVGITGVVTQEDATVVRDAFIESGLSSSETHYPMIGYLVSEQLIKGQDVNAKYPKPEDLYGLMATTAEAGDNFLHFFTSSKGEIFWQIKHLFDKAIIDPDTVSGFQLNIPWPHPYSLDLIKRKFPDRKIVLQLGPPVFNVDGPEDVAFKLKKYNQDLVDYILFDNSGGKGNLMDIEHIKPYFQQVREVRPDTNLVFAGGLTPENVVENYKRIRSLVGNGNFSWDIENGVRDMSGGRGGRLDSRKARAYIFRSAKVLDSSS